MISAYLAKQNEFKMKSLAQPEADIQFWVPSGPLRVTLGTLGPILDQNTVTDDDGSRLDRFSTENYL